MVTGMIMTSAPARVHTCPSVGHTFFPLLSVYSVCSVVALLVVDCRERGLTTDHTDHTE
jgi:hypothetical protein